MQGATGSANAQIGTATNVANITQGIANAQAGAQIGGANAYASGLNTLGNVAYMGAQNMGAGNTSAVNQANNQMSQWNNQSFAGQNNTAGLNPSNIISD